MADASGAMRDTTPNQNVNMGEMEAIFAFADFRRLGGSKVSSVGFARCAGSVHPGQLSPLFRDRSDVIRRQIKTVWRNRDTRIESGHVGMSASKNGGKSSSGARGRCRETTGKGLCGASNRQRVCNPAITG